MQNKRKNEKGFATIDRAILEWGWYSEPNTSRVFIHLIITANHAPHSFMGMVIERGQTVTGYHALSKTLGLSVSKIRTAFKNLKNTGELTIKVTSKCSIITLCNYELYNKKKDEDSKQDDNQVASTSQAFDNHLTTPNKKNKNKKKKNTNMVPPTLHEIGSYIQEKGYQVDAQYFFDKYENANPPWSNADGKLVRSWKGTLATWDNNIKEKQEKVTSTNRNKDGVCF